jgi:NTE family protein
MKAIALAFSGGGVRAMLFHLGVLDYLAEQRLCEQVRYISTVSGGTLLTGLIFEYSGRRWPTSEEFRERVAPRIAQVLRETNIQRSALVRLLLRPHNWRYLPFRATVLASAIAKVWHIRSSITDLPASPVWAINATTMESGRRWRFRSTPGDRALGEHNMGDGAVGYTFDPAVTLAEAMATSAAFPGGMSPLVVKTKQRVWFLPDFEFRSRPPRQIVPPSSAYHLADGGVYDNLGLEPLFDLGANALRPEAGCNYLIVADAGAPLRFTRWGFVSQLLGFAMRTINIMMAQQRNLRVRALIASFRAGRAHGVLIRIEQSARAAIAGAHPSRSEVCSRLAEERWLTSEQVKACSGYPTTLARPNASIQRLIRRQGYESAKVQLELWG